MCQTGFAHRIYVVHFTASNWNIKALCTTTDLFVLTERMCHIFEHDTFVCEKIKR